MRLNQSHRLITSCSVGIARATPISILYSTDTTWQTLTDLTTLSDGSYHYSWTPTTPATHRFKAVYAGDDTYVPSESVVLTIPLTKTASSITCSCPSTVSEGKTVTVTGGVDPAMNDRTVTLTYQKSNGGTLTRTVTTDTNGEYSDTYTPSEEGVWRVTASWEGDETYESATSSAMSFTVEKSGCLIATATYGSELTPQVQVLRNFRDDRVLQTFAGSQFMHVFNSFYYSWSPNVADTIRAHDSIATAMQPVLYPLIGILQISEGIFSVLSFHPELAVVATGGVASALLAGIYLLPLTLLISYFRKRAVSRTLVSAMGIIWLASLSAIVLAELTQSTALMMTATGSFVLATMGATVLSMMNVLPVLKKRLQPRPHP